MSPKAHLRINSISCEGIIELEIEEAWIGNTHRSSWLCYGLRIKVDNSKLEAQIEILEDRREPIHTLTLSKGKLFLNDKELADLGI